jgi:hypothetical protein
MVSRPRHVRVCVVAILMSAITCAPFIVQDWGSRLHTIVYMYKGKNWLETGGATYIIVDYMGENRKKNKITLFHWKTRFTLFWV